MAYGYYRSLTIDHTKCGSSSSLSFPVLVSISAATSVKTVANGGKINNTGTQTGGAGGTMPFDLVFSSDNAGASKYPWEVLLYDGTAGTLLAWVQIPSVSNSVDTVFYMVYGDAAVNTQQNTSTLSPSHVWDSNYKSVYHLGESSSPYKDSTSNALNSTGGTAPTQTTGKFGKGQSFDGSSTYISVGMPISSGNFTFSGWASITGGASSGFGPGVFATRASGQFNNPTLSMEPSAGGKTVFQNAGNNEIGATTIFNNGFHHVVAVYDGTNSIVYVDGGQDGTGVIGTPAYAGSTGSIGQDNFSRFFGGIIQEVRISTTNRPASWILTEYNNQNAPGNIGSAGFLTFGSETAISAGGGLFLDSTLSGLTTGGPFFRNPIG